MSKRTETVLIIALNLLLVFITVAASSLALASSPKFYEKTLRQSGIYAKTNENGDRTQRVIYSIGGNASVSATLTDAQLDVTVEHITDYLFHGKDSFELKLDNLHIIGEGYQNEVSIFGDHAISHMKDVRDLITAVRILLLISIPLFVFLTLMLIKKRLLGRIFSVSLKFYLSLIFLTLVFCIVTLIGAGKNGSFFLKLWENLHYLLFPFQPEKLEGSRLNDALVYILTTEFFIRALAYVLSILSLAISAWLAVPLLLRKKLKKEL